MRHARARLEALIDRLPSIARQADGSEALTAMMAEDQRHFSGLSTDEADWLRAHLYAAVALSPDPLRVANPAREDLRTTISPIVLAGIARALRAMKAGSDWLADIDAAAQRIRFKDIYPEFRFDPTRTCCRPALTCLGELEVARAAIAPDSDANSSVTSNVAEDLGALEAAFVRTKLEDQSGMPTDLATLANGRPLVLVLFYTRCMNPLKCSLAIARLGLAASQLRDLAFTGMTYDPAFDTPHRLLGYGGTRKVEFGSNASLVRCTGDWLALRDRLELRAGYGAATVNAHARELFLIDRTERLFRLPPSWLAEPEHLKAFAEGAD
ncbi:hypothetical protein LJR234_005589 [Mesorhizobium amorphae]|uniref:hypothetical protein n=1 Tax=Mesorhizobium amorphae TaxID=71433 RepID=UPI003ECCD029